MRCVHMRNMPQVCSVHVCTRKRIPWNSIFFSFLVDFLQHMVQAGVNPFPAGPGFTAAPTLNVTDGNLPVSVAVKNDALATALKPEASVNLTPAISVTQVSVCLASPSFFSSFI